MKLYITKFTGKIMQTRVAQVLSSIETEASGATYAVSHLNASLRRSGCDSRLVVLSQYGRHDSEDLVAFSVSSHMAWLGLSGEMKYWLRSAVLSKDVEIVHNHGLWKMPNVYAGQAVKGTDVPLVVSPHGTFSQWALSHSAWKKRLFWPLQKSGLVSVSCFHATAESEYLDIRRKGYTEPVAVIPNGVSIPELVEEKETVPSQRRKLLFLGRIHIVKAIDVLLRAWSRLETQFDDWELHIVGPDNEGYGSGFKKLADELDVQRVFFRDGVYSDDKAIEYQSADLFILPSRSENFGLTVAESLASATPAIVSTEAPWQGLDERNAGWWIHADEETLVSTLSEALALAPAALAGMGLNGRNWMQQEFGWEEIAARQFATYKWLLAGGSAPAWVRMD